MPDDPNSDTAPEEPTSERETAGPAERPLFLHPQWTVGVVLIFAVAAIVAGLDNPVWFIIGAPCILVLIVYVWARLWGGGRP